MSCELLGKKEGSFLLEVIKVHGSRHSPGYSKINAVVPISAVLSQIYGGIVEAMASQES